MSKLRTFSFSMWKIDFFHNITTETHLKYSAIIGPAITLIKGSYASLIFQRARQKLMSVSLYVDLFVAVFLLIVWDLKMLVILFMQRNGLAWTLIVEEKEWIWLFQHRIFDIWFIKDKINLSFLTNGRFSYKALSTLWAAFQ